MPIEEQLESFAGFKVLDFDPETGLQDTEQTIYRIRHDPDAGQTAGSGLLGGLLKRHKTPPPPPPDPVEALVADAQSAQLKGVVYGLWMEDYDTSASSAKAVASLAAAAGQLPAVKALFIGDMTYEECEISWITQSDMSPLFKAFPALEHFGVRGSQELKMGPVSHAQLKSLVIQCGGLPATVLHEVLQSRFPALEHLELWLGEENYGGDIKLSDLEPLWSGNLFPKLRYLGLRNSEISDEIADALAKAPILQRLETLDLSLGTLSDQGAAALLASPAVAQLKKLDIHHHYVSAEVVKQLRRLGPVLDASEVQEIDEANGEEFRYIAVGE